MAGGRQNRNLVKLLSDRLTWGDERAVLLEKERYITEDLVRRLGLYKELSGHEGCVNCLDWNKSGSILASGSDDQTVILWRGTSGDKLTQLSTDHQGNIFSVKFLPNQADNLLVTGAQDFRVCLLDVEKQSCIQSASPHMGRVKRLAVSPDCPGLFWSAAEDGTVIQWDIREKWQGGESNVLINLGRQLGKAEVKCIAVNPMRTELLAIGANDPYIRLYDRRKLTLSKLNKGDFQEFQNVYGRWRRRRSSLPKVAPTEGEPPAEAVKYFVPGHLPAMESKYKSILRPLACTYLEFGSRGNELVANMGGEHIYYYDKFSLFSNAPRSSLMDTLAVIKCCDNDVDGGNRSPCNGDHCYGYPGVSSSNDGPPPLSPPLLTADVEAIKLSANAAFGRLDYTEAINLYNRALALQGPHPLLYGNRAITLMKRKFAGDTYAALLDCVRALKLQPGHVKAMLRLARCLHEMEWANEAVVALSIFRNRYPDHVNSHDCVQLDEEIKSAAAERLKHKESKKSTEKSANSRNAPRRVITSRPHSLADFLRDIANPTDAASDSMNVDDDEDDDESDEEDDGDSSLDMIEVGEEMFTTSEDESCGGASEDDRLARLTACGKISAREAQWRKGAREYTRRYVGACNCSTDIKEASFLGPHSQFIMSGSDDGKIMIWDTQTTNLVKVLTGDMATVNCVQGHPCVPMLASSGIESVVRLWCPLADDGSEEPRNVKDVDKVIKDNQQRMSHKFDIAAEVSMERVVTDCRPS